MKKIIITIMLAFIVSASIAQSKFTSIPDCNRSIIFESYPCKIPVIKDGKTIGYTVENNQFISTAEYRGSQLYIRNLPTKWVPIGEYSFNYSGGHLFTIKQPNPNTGTDTILIKRKNLTWLNDSTAVYKPSNK